MAVAVVAALAIGASRPGPKSLDQRTLSLAGQVRCPVCSGESAAESQVPASVAIRTEIRQQLAAGESSSQVLAGLVKVYGTGILEKPQARGIGLLVWVIPAVALVVGVGGLGYAFSRWRRRAVATGVSSADESLVAEALSAGHLAGRRADPGDSGGADRPGGGLG